MLDRSERDLLAAEPSKAYASAATRPSVKATGGWLALLGRWAERRRQRRALIELDPRLLDDIAVTPREAAREYAKRFWQ